MAAELHVLAEIAVTGSADTTISTGVGRFNNDPFPGALSGGNDATHLVSQHEWIMNSVLADAAFLEPVQIGAA